jgi:hypothetical protein
MNGQNVPHWQGQDVVFGLALLTVLIFLQVFLYRTGHWPDPGFGLRAEVYRFFPTVLTGYAVLWMARRRQMTLGDLGFSRHRILWPAFVAWLVAFASGPLFLGLFSVSAIRPAALGVFFIPAVLMLGYWHGGRRSGRRGDYLPRSALQRIPPAMLPCSRSLSQRTVLCDLPPERPHATSVDIHGAAIAWAYARTGSIWAAILPYAGLNAVVFIVLVRDAGLAVSGTRIVGLNHRNRVVDGETSSGREQSTWARDRNVNPSVVCQ